MSAEALCRCCCSPTEPVFASSLSHSVCSAGVPCRTPARVRRCTRCGLLQKAESQIVADYHHYPLFDNDPCADKIVRTPGQPDRTRSRFVADLLLAETPGCRTGRVLEVGCHRGVFLRALREEAPDVQLVGYDVTPEHRECVEVICGPGRYYHGSLDAVPGPFDAAVLIHTLEHIPDPCATLRTLARLVRPGGTLIVLVPDCEANPSDFYTIDHTTHFEAVKLRKLLNDGGFPGGVSGTLIPNELVALARRAEPDALPDAGPTPGLAARVAQLAAFERGLDLLPPGELHVFGTALIGALAGAVLGGRCIGYADEAEFRVGKRFLGKPVRHPRDLAGEPVVLGVAPSVARAVGPRLRSFGCSVLNPWECSEHAQKRIPA